MFPKYILHMFISLNIHSFYKKLDIILIFLFLVTIQCPGEELVIGPDEFHGQTEQYYLKLLKAKDNLALQMMILSEMICKRRAGREESHCSPTSTSSPTSLGAIHKILEPL